MVLWAGLLLLPGTAAAQTPMSLADAVAMAVRNDSRVREAEAKEESARQQAAVSRAKFGPNLFTGTGAMYTYGFPQTPGGAPPSVFNLAFTQTLFDGPAKGQERAASERIEVQRLEAARVRNAAMVEAALAYLELAGVRQALDRQQAARDSAEGVVDALNRQLGEGRVLPVDVLEARLAAAKLTQRITQLEGRDATLENQLRVLTGGAPGQRVAVTAGALPALPDRPPAELVALATTANVALQSARAERQAREEELAGTRQGYWPSVDLVGNYAVFSRFNNLDTFFNRFQRHNVNVGIEARVPLFAAATGPSVAAARSAVVEADAAVRQQQEQIELDVLSALQADREAAAARAVEELQLAVAQENVRVANARVGEGRANRLDALRAQVEEGRAWDAFYQAEFAQQRGELQLRQLTGELNRLFP
jgi:outer membrane protein TolC